MIRLLISIYDHQRLIQHLDSRLAISPPPPPPSPSTIICKINREKDGQPDISTTQCVYEMVIQETNHSINFSEKQTIFKTDMDAYIEPLLQRSLFFSSYLNGDFVQTYHHGQLQSLGSKTFLLFLCCVALNVFFFFPLSFLL